MPKQKGKENERRDGADMAISPPDRVEYERAMADVLEQMRQKQAQLSTKVPLTSNDQKSLQHVRGSDESSPQLQRPTPSVEGAQEDQLAAEKEKLMKEKSETVAEQKHIEQMLRQISSDITEKKEESDKLRANLQYTKEEAYDTAIKKLQEQLQCHNSESEAKKLEEEVRNLQLSKQNLRVYEEIEGTVVQLKKEQEGMRSRRNHLYSQLSVIKSKERSFHRQSSSEVKSRGTNAVQRATLRDEIDALNRKRQQLIQDFKHRQDVYLASQEAERERGRQERERKVEEKKLKEVEKKSRETLLTRGGGEADDSAVLAKETAQRQALLCSTLTTFLKRSFKTKEDGEGGGDSPSNGSPGMAVPRHAEVVGAVQQSQGATRKDWPEQGVYIKKKETAEEYYTPKPLQRRRSKKEKMKPATAPKVTTRLQLSPLMLEQFGELKVNPPATLGDVPATLALLQQKMSLLCNDLQGGLDSGIVSVEHSDSEVPPPSPDVRVD